MSAPRCGPDVAETIAQQMGGIGALRAMLGARQVARLPDGCGLAVQWPNRHRSKGNVFHVRLAPDDTYSVEFFNGRTMESVARFDDIYADSLIDVFERHTGWALRVPRFAR